jgi:hypothetical protein
MTTLETDLKKALEAEVARIPKPFRHDEVIRQTVKCFLYGILKEAGLWPVPDFRPPRLTDGLLDLIGVAPSGAVVSAFAVRPVVELKAVKSLEALEVEKKWMITFSTLSKKVKESTFFLKPGIQHLHLELK